jgi:hypothetical protein
VKYASVRATVVLGTSLALWSDADNSNASASGSVAWVCAGDWAVDASRRHPSHLPSRQRRRRWPSLAPLVRRCQRGRSRQQRQRRRLYRGRRCTACIHCPASRVHRAARLHAGTESIGAEFVRVCRLHRLPPRASPRAGSVLESRLCTGATNPLRLLLSIVHLGHRPRSTSCSWRSVVVSS